jgi:diguanylate cyclase (GGDEF)-like protein
MDGSKTMAGVGVSGLSAAPLLALAGGSILLLACALVACLWHLGNHDVLDWNAGLELALLSAGLTGTLALTSHALGLRGRFERHQREQDDVRCRNTETVAAPTLYDALTGLPNQTLVADRVRQAIADGARTGIPFAFMILGLDRFKEVNDSLGHGAGDALLHASAARLRAQLRPCDTVARLGGDEFAVLLPGVRGADEPGLVAHKLITALTAPYLLDGHEIVVSASIGIALFPDDGAGIDDLFRFADSALAHAKRAGRNNFQFYVTELTARSSERLEMAAALHKAARCGELDVYFQPQVDLRDGTIVGVEALLRWNRPGHGFVPPDRFIPIAEESGLIVEIGEWVLETACRTVVAWNGAREQPIAVSVNVSTRQFIRHDFVATVERVLATNGCRPAWLKLEITESLLLEKNEDISRMLDRLHALGLAISIDDFGTGYSALGYLNRFPVSQIKIDRSFVSDIPQDRDKSELVKAILSIAAALRLQVIAEGVETNDQVDYLLEHGCWCVQGYLFGVPMPRAALDAVLLDMCGRKERRLPAVVPMVASSTTPDIMGFSQSETTTFARSRCTA